jgi:protein-disulfide isomerase
MANEKAKKWYTRWWAITLYIIVGLFIILLLIPAPQQKDQGKDLIKKFKQGNQELSEEEEEWLAASDAPSYGTSSPEVTIVEFFSFDCPGAAQMHSTVREIGIQYKDEVQVIFRHFPTNEKAIQYSVAAECAHQQGKFWGMYDKLFQNRSQMSVDKITPLANQLGLDMNKFSQCVQNEKSLKRVKQDMREGNKLGVQGSPTTYINGHKIERPIPEKVFKTIIEEILK